MVNLPQGACARNIIVVSSDGSYKNTDQIVNPKWLESSNTNEASCLGKFTFNLKGQSFLVFGKSTLSGMTEAELSLWGTNLEETIQNHMGTLSEELTDQTFVVFPSCSKGSEQLVTQIKAFI